MLPPVIVDLGADVGARDAQVVLAACNDAIANGVCLPAGSPEGERPRAIAVVRAADRRVLVVRIEVRLAAGLGAEGSPGANDDVEAEEAGAPIVRKIRFALRDPLRERWRSVGLAIATLVGEGERRVRDEEAEHAPEESAPPTPAPTPTPAPPGAETAAPETGVVPEAERVPESRPPELEQPQNPAQTESPAEPVELARAPEARAGDEEPNDEDDAGAEALDAGEEVEGAELQRLPFEHRPLFVGVGVLTGPGIGTGAWRAGGNLRAGWQHAAGWQIATSLGAAWRTSQATFSAAWLSLDAGVGYRWPLSDALTLGTLVFGGVEGARFEVLARGEESSEVRLNPRVGLALDARWRVSPSFGAWISADVSSSGRETRLFIAPDREPIVGAPIEIGLSLGLGWWPE